MFALDAFVRSITVQVGVTSLFGLEALFSCQS